MAKQNNQTARQGAQVTKVQIYVHLPRYGQHHINYRILVDQVHSTMGKANLSNDFLVRPTIVMNYTTKVCKNFGDFNILTTCMNRLNCATQQASKRTGLGSGLDTFSPSCFASS